MSFHGDAWILTYDDFLDLDFKPLVLQAMNFPS